MILPDGTPASKTSVKADQAAPVDETQRLNVNLPPPAYTDIPQAQPDMASPSAPIYHQPFYTPRRESAGRRFFRAFVVALLVWFVLGMLIRSIVDLAHSGRRTRGPWVSAPRLLRIQIITAG